MYNKQLVIAALALLSSAFAHADCANFTGNWQGTCNTNGQVQADQIAIQQQGCEVINLGGLVSEIGNTKTYSQTQGDIVTTVSIMTKWSDDRTQLPGHLTVVKRSQSQGREQRADFDTGMGMDGSNKLMIVARASNGSIVRCSYDRR